MKNKRMKIARIECDLTQEQLADKVGVARQTIGLIEAGNYNPSISLCIEICKALNKTLDDLLNMGASFDANSFFEGLED